MGKSSNKAFRRILKAFIDSKPKKIIEISKSLISKEDTPRFSLHELIQQSKSHKKQPETLIFHKKERLIIINNAEFKIERLFISKFNTYLNSDFPIYLSSPNEFRMNHSFARFKVQCLECLFRMSSESDVRLPGYIEEIIIGPNNSFRPSFLFFIKQKEDLFIIWESLEDLRATYIFNCNLKTIQDEAQKIIDFIGSTTFTLKRHYLSKSKELAIFLKLKSKVSHEKSYEKWLTSLKKGLICL